MSRVIRGQHIPFTMDASNTTKILHTASSEEVVITTVPGAGANIVIDIYTSNTQGLEDVSSDSWIATARWDIGTGQLESGAASITISTDGKRVKINADDIATVKLVATVTAGEVEIQASQITFA